MSELYSYYLKVEGSEQDQLTVFNMLKEKGILDEHLSPVGGDFGYYADYKVFTYEWDEHDAVLHEIALKVPNATITLEAESREYNYAFDKQYKGDLFRMVNLKSYMPRIAEQEFTSFENRFNAPVTSAIPPEFKVQNVYVLCEQHEEPDGMRQTTILQVSTNKKALQELMKAKIEKDDYGIIAQNGYEEIDDNYFCTNYKQEFLEYYISEQPLSYDAPTRAYSQEKEALKTPLDAQIRQATENTKPAQLHSDKALQR